MQEQNNIQKSILQDGNKNWKKHKLDAIELSESYQRLHIYNKSDRVKDCGDFLEFKKYENGTMKLNHANFCKVRLCPMCAWRRSLKIYGQVSEVMDDMQNTKQYQYVFVTLSRKNVAGEELSVELDELFKGFKLFTKKKMFKKAVKGYFRALEVTHNLKKNTYHPHFHMVVAVNPSYFTDKTYISQANWVKMWREALHLDYNPNVHVMRVKDLSNENNLNKAVAEVAKYTLKSNDYLVKDKNGKTNMKATDEAVMVLDNALARRRLMAFGGIMRDAHKRLNLDDTTDGDLVNTNNNKDMREDLKFVIEHYHWSMGYSNYMKKDIPVVSEETEDIKGEYKKNDININTFSEPLMRARVDNIFDDIFAGSGDVQNRGDFTSPAKNENLRMHVKQLE